MSTPPPRFIAYERVSTARQGQSGLGLEAQRVTIDDFARSRGAEESLFRKAVEPSA
ncbi:hypothetical protein [Defluviimonas sp. SAOS-178_SWC]|uniref:hypothetical protein n=1 Tax=Defluviimonas sp. SAOS-178_SWC TaxID=3121287 RepID=UPI0032217662